MKETPVALQLYSLRDRMENDLEEVLKEVAKMGYDGVEFAGLYGRSPGAVRAILDRRGLKCAGAHIRFASILPECLDRTLEFHQELSAPYLIVASLPDERRASPQTWRETAAVFAEASPRAREAGMWVGYHNHAIEFQPVDGEIPWDIFFGETPREVVMQLDTGNCLLGGGDPVEYLRRYPGRARSIHLKDYSAADPQVLLGEGEVDWRPLLQLCQDQGETDWYVIEQENHPTAPLASVEQSLRNLRTLLEG